MPAELSEFAEFGLRRCFGDTEKALAYRHSIRLHLSHPEAVSRWIRLPAPLKQSLYVMYLHEVRVMWEARHPENWVWSVSLHRP
jgi:hypothetical protein